MEEETKNKFFADYHRSLTDGLNHISGDLLRAKWFFLEEGMRVKPSKFIWDGKLE